MTEPLLIEVDQIYHLACPASPIFYKYNPVKVCIYEFHVWFICRYSFYNQFLLILTLLFFLVYIILWKPLVSMTCWIVFNLNAYQTWQTIKTNVIGTLNMLGLAKRVGARFEIVPQFTWCDKTSQYNLAYSFMVTGNRILLTSTSEVYGDPLVHPQDESYWGNVNPIGMFSFVLKDGIMKLIGELGGWLVRNNVINFGEYLNVKDLCEPLTIFFHLLLLYVFMKLI